MKNTLLALTLAMVPAAFSQDANPPAAPVPPVVAPPPAGQPAVQPQPGQNGMGGGMMGGMMGRNNLGSIGSLLSDAAKVAEFAEYDTNKDGQLSDEEIEAAKDKVFEHFKAEAKKYNKQVLGQYDLDKNGKLDDTKKEGKADSELGMFMKFIAWQEQGWQIQQTLITKFDKNGDGQLTGDEARQAMLPRMEMEYDRSLTLLFKDCDKNNDGKFDAQELAAAKQLATKKYDRDGNGKVDPRESFQATMEAQPLIPGGGGIDMQQFGGRFGGRGGNNGGAAAGGQPGQPGGMGGRGGGRAGRGGGNQIIAPPIDE